MNHIVGSDSQRISTVDAAVASLAPTDRCLRVLLMADDAHPSDAVLDHIKSIKRHSRHHVTVLNPITNRRGWLMDVVRFDVIVIHYSICILYDHYLPEPVAASVKAFPGPKIQIIQDEMRWVDRMARRMSALGIGAVFSSLTPENIAKVYRHGHLAHVRFVSGLPGYVSDRLHRVRPQPLSERPFHLVYRGRPLPISLGKFSQEKVQIGLQALAMAEKYGLRIDCKLGESDRVYGSKWNDLLMTGRAALATEGGATVFDFDESVERKFEDFHQKYPDADDNETWEAVIKPHEGNIVHKTITPRVFEAVMCRTALVMYPGEYRGVLQPWEHYIPLERDGSNEAEVMQWLQDETRLEELTERAYRRVANDRTLQFSHYTAAIDAVASELVRKDDAKRTASEKRAGSYIDWAPVRFTLKITERRISAFENPQSVSYRLWSNISAVLRAPISAFENPNSRSYRLRKNVQVVLRAPAVLGRSFMNALIGRRLDRFPSSKESHRDQDIAKADKPGELQADGGFNVLVLCDFNFLHIGTVKDHLEAFKTYSRHTICVADAKSASKLNVDLNKFDVVVLHYTLIISMQEYLPTVLARKISEFGGYKILFIQDEYRWVDRTAAAIADLGIDLIYTVINEDAVDKVYRHPSIRHVRRKTTLTGFVPEELTRCNVPPFHERRIDIGYRARRVPAWIGHFSQEKWLIGERFKQEAEAYGLVCDIEDAESRRLYGEKWIAFVNRCKAMLGTESGASFIDFTGEVQRTVEAYERANPYADFAEIRDRFLKGDGDIVIRVISPRCFEAAALRTLMILYAGDYSGALQPWRHYVPLERDHSNMDEVVAVLRDPKRAQEIIDNAYREVALNPRYSFRAMVEEFDQDLDDHASRTSIAAMRQGTLEPAVSGDRSAYAIRAFERQVEKTYRINRALLLNVKQLVYKAVNQAILTVIPESNQAVVRNRIKAAAKRIGVLKSQG